MASQEGLLLHIYNNPNCTQISLQSDNNPLGLTYGPSEQLITMETKKKWIKRTIKNKITYLNVTPEGEKLAKELIENSYNKSKKIPDKQILNVEKKHYPKQGTHNKGFELTGVLHGRRWPDGSVFDCGCYVGIGTDEWVAKHGAKISYAEVISTYFPNLKEESYRR